MTRKPYSRMFGVSLLVTGLSSLVLSLTNLFAWPLPDWAARLAGVAGLVALPFLVYAYVKTYIKKA